MAQDGTESTWENMMPSWSHSIPVLKDALGDLNVEKIE